MDHVNIDMCEYDSHEAMVERLRALEVSHPGLAKTGIIGKTVEGRDLLYIKVGHKSGVRSSVSVRVSEAWRSCATHSSCFFRLLTFPTDRTTATATATTAAEKNRVPLTETH